MLTTGGIADAEESSSRGKEMFVRNRQRWMDWLNRLFVGLFIGSSIVGTIYVASAATTAAPTPGLGSLHRIDRLPVFRSSVKIASQSSYDRTGGNDDGFSGNYSFVRKEPGGLVLLDVAGPGIIHRIWTPTPTNDIIEFYFDGEEKPRLSLPFHNLFNGKHEAFVRPLVGSGAGGFYSYIPLPYKKSCKIVIKADRMQFYQINYSTYGAEQPIETFSLPRSDAQQRDLNKACQLLALAGKDISEYTATNPSKRVVHKQKLTLKPGETTTLFDTNEPGRIVGIRLSPASALTGKDRGIVLRAYWDGDEQPAINAPAGDFFGYAWGQPATRSLLVGTVDGVDYSYFPMPYDKSAKLELVSERTDGEPVDITAEIITEPTPRTADEGRFYALWRRENPTTKGKPFTFIDTQGRGHIVGCFQQSQDVGNTYFFEGDDQTTIDGELVIHGTGAEDFYNGGWYDVPDRWEARRSFPLSGCLGYQKQLGRSGGYRLMLGDAYAFNESILQTIEHAPTGNETPNDYVGLTFLYSAQRPTCSFDLPPLAERRVVDPQRLSFSPWWNEPIHAWSFQNARLVRLDEKLKGDGTRLLSLQGEGGDAFGLHFISFSCNIPAAGDYRVSLVAAEGPEQGSVQLFRDESAIGPPTDFHAKERQLSEARPLGELHLEEGTNNLLIKLVAKPEGTNVYRADFRELILERVTK